MNYQPYLPIDSLIHVQAKQYLEDGEEEEIPKMADPAMGGRYDLGQLRNMAWAAKLCIQTSPDHRPLMSKVRGSQVCLAVQITS